MSRYFEKKVCRIAKCIILCQQKTNHEQQILPPETIPVLGQNVFLNLLNPCAAAGTCARCRSIYLSLLRNVHVFNAEGLLYDLIRLSDLLDTVADEWSAGNK